MTDNTQQLLFENGLNGASTAEATPAILWEQNAVKRALDELFSLTFQYKASKAYHDLMQFIARFRFYSPYNAMLVHIQMPGARFVAPPYRWLRNYGRRIKPGARPLVILQPMGPVMFVFDVSDTENINANSTLPAEIEKPFEVRKGNAGDKLNMVIENAKRDGIRISRSNEGSQSAGSIGLVDEETRQTQKFKVGIDSHRNPVYVEVPVKYHLLVNSKLSSEAQYATIVHELAHLYCGHLGTPNNRWWPDRRGLSHAVREFEAESVSYIICARSNIDTPSEQYLAGYVKKEDQVPKISLECVMKAAGLIENMSRLKMKLRKNNSAG